VCGRGAIIPSGSRPERAGLGLYKILFYVEAIVYESIILLLQPPTCIAHTIALLLHIH